ncbi:MAG: hypothetical protein Q8R95_00825, partial [Azonexus sp.]|nr:hypothetical protein [Azonexus sp.]
TPFIDLLVSNDEQAFALLEKAFNNELGYKPYKVKFNNWPVLKIKLEGDGYDGTITADMAAGLVEFQHAMNRSYARLVHNSANARVLSSDEREALKFKAKVEKGSAIYEINLGPWAEQLVMGAINKMNPEHLVMTTVGLAIVAAGTLTAKWYLSHRSEDKKVESELQTRIVMSQEETRRHEILVKALTQKPVIDFARQDFDVARTGLLKGVGDAEKLTLSGIEISNEAAHAIARAKRMESKEIQINGNYKILRVDWQQEDEVRLKVLNIESSLEFMASCTDKSLEKDQISLLQDAEWSRSTVYLSINATELRGEITTATIVNVVKQPAAT